MKNNNNNQQPPIAIVGLSAILPGPHRDAYFWQDIVNGVDHVSEVPDSHWLVSDYFDESLTAADKTYCKRGAFLSPTPFNPLEFGIPPSAIPSTDTAQLLALIAAKRILSDVLPDDRTPIDRDKISVILGMTSTTELVTQMSNRLQRPIWIKSMRECGLPEQEIETICDRIEQHYVPWQESTFPGLLGNVVAGRIANRLDIGGSNYVTDAACASSIAAISAGINELELGYSDLVISGGVDAMNDILMYMCFSKTPALSPTGDCRPFSDAADGTMLGEGIVLFALRRLEDAEHDDMPIYAVIRGLGSASDGKATSVYAPHPQGQAKALRRAYDRAGYGPDTVELVEAHGTATKAGDLAEFSALNTVFKEPGAEKERWCALGSIKSQIGHTKAAAGAAGFLKAVLSLHHKVLPPTLKVNQPNPKFDINTSPFYLNTLAKPWIRGSEHPRRASVSSFGFGGSNFHVTLEEYTGTTKSAEKIRVFPTELMLFSAQSKQDLLEQVYALSGQEDELSLEQSARMSQQAFDSSDPHRLSLVVQNRQQLKDQIHLIAETIDLQPNNQIIVNDGFSYQAEADRTGKIAFMVPGQGSQYLNMGDQLAMSFDQARLVWDRAASELTTAPPLHEIVFPPTSFSDQERLRESEKLSEMSWTQPAIGAVSLAHLEILMALGLEPDMTAGHSFGEVMALSFAGAFDGQTALKIARKRGELMTQAATVAGAMTAISLTIDEVRELLQDNPRDLVIANHNSPSQVVVSGVVAEIEDFEIDLKAKNVSFSRLNVKSAFHSPLISTSCEPFLAFLQGLPIQAPATPVFCNSTAKPYPREPEAIRRQLVSQLAKPVQFVEQIDAMYDAGARVFIEVGPSNVLTGLVRQCLGRRKHLAINMDKQGEHGVTTLHKAIGQLSVAGVKLDYEPLWNQFTLCSMHQDGGQPHSIEITGSNYGKPYPPVGGVDELPEPNEARAERSEPINSPLPDPDGLPEFSNPRPVAESKDKFTSQTILNPTEQQTAPVAAQNEKDYKAAAYHAFQKHTAEAHMAFQKSMSDSHQAFLQLAEKTLLSLQTNQNTLGNELSALDFSTSQKNLDSGDGQSGYSHEDSDHASSDPMISRQPQPSAPSDQRQQADATSKAQQIEEAQPLPNPLECIESVLLSIVAEKTGYPQDMLTGDMELESGLGIDSIKRVEIFSALQDKFVDLPEFDPAQMSNLQTLAQIIEFIEQETTVTGTQIAADREPSESAANSINPRQLVFDIISEKTGYPAEMLSDDMELEAGLGIDSIKRVEIFSGLQDKVTDLPEVDPADMAKFATLGQIVQFIDPTPATATTESGHKNSIPALVVEKRDLQRSILKSVESPASGFSMAGFRAAKQISIIADQLGVAPILANALCKCGLNVQIQESVSADADAIIFLAALRKDCSDQDNLFIHQQAFLAAKTVANRFESSGGVFVTVQDTGGDFALSSSSLDSAWLSGFPGLVKTAAIEWPKVTAKAIDIACSGRSNEEIADMLVNELLDGGPEIEVGFPSQSRRITLTTAPATLKTADQKAIHSESVWVVSGGARGVTAACLETIAKKYRPKLVLLGRTTLTAEPEETRNLVDEIDIRRWILQQAKASGNSVPSATEITKKVDNILSIRAIKETLRRIEQFGSPVRYEIADVRDSADIDRVLNQIRTDWGPITGLVHGAGVLSDRRIVDKEIDQFDRVFTTKVKGLKVLLEQTKADPLNIICMFSSVAARRGNIGQCDYAMANEVINKVAQTEARRRRGTCLVKSINWGPWDGGMVSASLKAHFEKQGISLIPLDAGAQFFGRELSDVSDQQVEVVVGAEQRTFSPLGVASIEKKMEIEITPDMIDHYQDHAINGAPVLPMTQVIDWFLRVARSNRPGIRNIILKEISVLKGVLFDSSNSSPDHRYQIICGHENSSSTEALDLQLLSLDGTPHYRAKFEVSDQPPKVIKAFDEPAVECHSWPYTVEYAYQERLFHGPRFHVIQELDSLSDQGGAALLDGQLGVQWPDAAHCFTDPVLLDGGLQLLLLWAFEQTGKTSLPTAIGECRCYGSEPMPNTVCCQFTSRIDGQFRTVSDLIFTDLDARILVELRDVEMHLLDEPSQIEMR